MSAGDHISDQMVGRTVSAANRLCEILLGTNKAASRVDSCSCRRKAAVGVDTAPKDWTAGIEAAVVAVAGCRLVVALAEVANVIAGRNQGCMGAEGHRRAGKEECFVGVEQAVVVHSAVAEGLGSVELAQARRRLDYSSLALTSGIVSLSFVAYVCYNRGQYRVFGWHEYMAPGRGRGLGGWVRGTWSCGGGGYEFVQGETK